MSCQPAKLVLLQWEIPVAPAEPAAVDQPVLDGRHLERGERLTERTLVISKLGDLDRCILGALHVSMEARSVGGLDRHIGRDADGAGLEKQVSQDAYPRDREHREQRVEPLYSGLRPRRGSSSSGSSGRNESCRCASSTMRRLSATSGVS